MDMATFTRVIDDLHRLGTRRIDLVGRGEPLLNSHAIDMIGSAKQRGFEVAMISNGSRLLDRAQGLVDVGLDRYRVSLDAALPETYQKMHVSETAASFRRVKDGLRHLADARRRSGGRVPHLTLSFTIGALNFDELVQMVETAVEVGADAAHFQYCLPLTPEAEAAVLSAAQQATLRTTLIPAALARAATLDLETNLRTFAASPPPYGFDREETGPAVVPCYVGSYFTAILGNGSVMPCCQTQRPIGSLATESFAAIWRGDAYAEFRRAARGLPTPSPALATCECDKCYFRAHNVTIHNALHPFSRIPVQSTEELLSIDHLNRMSRLDRR
jgi:MoaA/NifB/PqqE/SkfB family radical SAM enzyme